MTEVNSIDATNNSSNYSAVKIRVNEPKAFISGKGDGINGNCNAVDIAVDKPFMAQYDHEIYSYPKYDEPVNGNLAIINAEHNYYPIAPENTYKNNIQDVEAEDITEEPKSDEVKEDITTEAEPVVPEPNVTTPEDEKKNLINFNGKQLEIVPPQEIKPKVDVNSVVSNLANADYDVQAKQMYIIIDTALTNPKEAEEYINKPVFSGLIKVLKNNTADLVKPSEQQIEARKKIILNEMVKQKAEQEGKKDVKLPFTLSEDEIKSAIILSPYEQAERNKEYAMYSIAALDKIYIDETEKRSGNVLPLTDLPGVSEMVEVLKGNEASTKLVALESLYYIKRPEYKEELKSIYSMASSDENQGVAQIASEMMKALDKE